MLFGDRADGKRVRNAPRLRQFMPYLMPSRVGSSVYFKQHIDVGETLGYIERWNDGTRPELRPFHVYMAAIVRVLGERPEMNRFIAGARLYQRDDVAMSIAVIKTKSDDTQLTVVKQIFQNEDGIRKVRDLTEQAIGEGRSRTRLTRSENELKQIFKLPRILFPVLPKLQKFTDWLNVTPKALAGNDPLYASVMISHLGSIGLDSAYHHLFEHGTLPIFAVIGKVHPRMVIGEDGTSQIRPMVTIRYTFDERVADGFYAARSLDRLKDLMEKPWLLERSEDDGPGAP
ncbi:2-oxo acid dehydrogenase subunit E2 [Roseivivax sp. CAU 1753]